MTGTVLVTLLTSLAVASVRRLMVAAPTTAYRKSVLDDIERHIAEVDLANRVAQPAMPPRTRALLLMAMRPLEAQEEPLAAYVHGVVVGEALEVLAERVQATHSVELMQRFLRYARGVDRLEVRKMCAVTKVMTS
jgi:hypothetical protein